MRINNMPSHAAFAKVVASPYASRSLREGGELPGFLKREAGRNMLRLFEVRLTAEKDG